MSFRVHAPLALVLAFVAGCSSSGNDPKSGTKAEIDPESGLPFCGDKPTEKCVDKVGAKYCPVQTGFEGDELALCGPGTDDGMLIHYGPQNYDDPDEIANYYIEPGDEDENCMFVHTPNTVDKLVTNYHGRMRPNSHHLIIMSLEGERADSTKPESCNLTEFVGARWLVGAQDPVIDVSIGGLGKESGADVPVKGDPDFGLAQNIKANTPLRLDMHYVNPSNERMLREAWVTFDYVEKYENLVDMITFFQGSISVPPHGEFTTARGRCEAKTDRYLGLVTGHAHQTMTRTTVWHEKLNGETNKVYETFDWFEPGNLYYRDGITNPTPNEASRQMGGASGFVEVKKGEVLTFECQYKNDTNGTLTLGETTKDEMCNIFGMYYPTDGEVWNCLCLDANCSDTRLAQ